VWWILNKLASVADAKALLEGRMLVDIEDTRLELALV
jgi:hypothetical protein